MAERLKKQGDLLRAIVRVWGWSGYFCELDEPCQDHVVARHMHAV